MSDTQVILVVSGSDRPGLTKALADAVHAAGGNWLESHLSRLGGKYVGSVLVELALAALPELETQVRKVDASGLRVSIVPADADARADGDTLTVELVGQDRPGIVREVTAVLAMLGVNIDSLKTGTEHGAWSGEPLFRAQARVTLPDGVDQDEVQEALEAISGDVMVDFTVRKADL
ncbi:glycine cleavage system protein R [Novosphingobium sp. Gsoil 351]|uniref:glycine cleavage system protein R n=1 Tax=Novosphingobium sp. Gsoil 351 TaxID=2675225 RepID=UPI0012B462F8|nr:ACT domain-containing protein [Novosphingobium sp. Gsoil 351]QGN53745.1 ACT domain-containing protein [Novosphingobium sp. Gsoil 351]